MIRARSSKRRSSLTAPSLAGRFHRARARRAEEGGFTLIETVVTLAIVTTILGIALGVVTNLFQQSQDVHDTITGVQQDQTAGQALTQYLHSAIVILPGSNATTLNASILAGINASDNPGTATLSAVLTNSANPKLDATFRTTLTPDGGQASSVSTYDAVNSQTVQSVSTVTNSRTVTVASGGFTGVLNGMAVYGTGIPPSTTVAGFSGNSLTLSNNATASGTVSLTFGSGGFTYYYDNYSTTPVSLSSTTTPGSGGVEYSQVVAVGIDMTFLAGPHVPSEGFLADRPSNFQTTVYLQNASGAPAPTTTVSIVPSGTIAVGQALTMTATVSANGTQPDGGNVTWTVTSNGTTLSVCTAPVDINTGTGTAACTFTPATGGSYVVTAAYSGTSDFQPSTNSTTVTVPYTTSMILTVTPSGSGSNNAQLAILAALSSQGGTPTGYVSFTITNGSCYTGCTATVPLSSGSAAWTKTGLSQFTTYRVQASYTDSTGTYQSTSGSWTGPA